MASRLAAWARIARDGGYTARLAPQLSLWSVPYRSLTESRSTLRMWRARGCAVTIQWAVAVGMSTKILRGNESLVAARTLSTCY